MLHWAAAGGHGDILKLLINNYSVDPDIRDEVGCLSFTTRITRTMLQQFDTELRMTVNCISCQ